MTSPKVTLINYMGDDLAVVDAARVSFNKESEWEQGEDGILRLSERDSKLITYLAKHNHWTPFAHCMVSFRMAMPLFVARQWYRHTVGFARNEVSRRYVDDAPTFFVPNEWREAVENKKQGSGGVHKDSVAFSNDFFWCIENSRQLYMYMIEQGVAAEQARMVLPQSMYTEFIETASLAAL